MTPNEAQAKTIEDAIAALDAFLDSDAFMEMINGLETPTEVRKQLFGLWAKRTKLTTALLRLYAKDIAANDEKVRKLILGLGELHDEVKKAADELEETADRIESAIEVAKGVDEVLQLLVALGVLAL